MAVLAAPLTTCATNPATGDRQLMLVGRLLPYSRDDERQADRLGMRRLMAHDCDPSKAVHVFQMLDRQSETAATRSGLCPPLSSPLPP